MSYQDISDDVFKELGLSKVDGYTKYSLDLHEQHMDILSNASKNCRYYEQEKYGIAILVEKVNYIYMSMRNNIGVKDVRSILDQINLLKQCEKHTDILPLDKWSNEIENYMRFKKIPQ